VLHRHIAELRYGTCWLRIRERSYLEIGVGHVDCLANHRRVIQQHHELPRKNVLLP
jgi:hypothetical protein